MRKRETIIKKIKEILEEEPNIFFAFIFGSFVEGKKYNDIDIAVYIGERVTDPSSLEMALGEKLEGVLHLPCDVRVINQAPLGFLYNILKKRVLIIDRESTLRSDFESRILREYFDFRHLLLEYLRELQHVPLRP